MHPYATLHRLLGPPRRRQLMAVLALMLAGTLAELLTIGAVLPFLALIADRRHIAQPLRVVIDLLGPYPVPTAALLLIVAALLAAIIRLLLLWITQRFTMGLGHDLAVRIFHNMLRQPYPAYTRGSSSRILSGIEKVQQVVFGLLLPVMQGIISAFTAAAIILFLFLIDPVAASIGAVCVALVYGAVTLATRRRMRRLSTEIARNATARIKTVQESLGGIRDIMLDRSQPLFEAKFGRLDAQYRRAQADNFFIANAPRYVIEAAAVVAVALLALTFSLRPGGIRQAIPVLGALAIGAQRLLPLIQHAYVGWCQTLANRQLLADVVELIEAPVLETLPGPAPAPPPFDRHIAFDAVSYGHGRGGFTLETLSFVIPRGACVGLTGPTGSGKSTLIDLLLGLLEPDAGEIRIDDRPLDRSSRAGWQAQIAHVPQSIHLADDTIAANIAFGESEPDGARVRAAATAACLDGFVDALPDGYATRVGERGIMLSGGQRQRLGIARALYKASPVLILDEATSALDEETENAVMRSVLSLRGELTIVMVAHRLSTLAHCDRILRLEAGKLVEAAPIAAVARSAKRGGR